MEQQEVAQVSRDQDFSVLVRSEELLVVASATQLAVAGSRRLVLPVLEFVRDLRRETVVDIEGGHGRITQRWPLSDCR